MKKIISVFLAFCVFGVSNVISQNIINLNTNTNGFSIGFTLPTYTIVNKNIKAEYGIDQNYSYINISNFGAMDDVGYPNLPQYTIDLNVPIDATTYSVTVTNLVTETKTLTYKILPAQDTTLDVNSFIINNAYYNSSGSLYAFKYQISDTFNIMGASGISFSIFPFQYNPSTNKLVVIKSCTFTITHNGSSSTNLKSQVLNNTATNNYLNSIFINYPTLKDGTLERGKYLIITYPKYEPYIKTFANYKRYIGYDVTLVNTNVTGITAAQIKSYIKNLYDNLNTRPEFVLLVGNNREIPFSVNDPSSDLDYARLNGKDYQPDVFLGRFNVKGELALDNLIFKTIYMETNLANLTKRALFVSGHDDNSIKGIVMETRFHNSMKLVKEHFDMLGIQNEFFSGFNGDSKTDLFNVIYNNNYTIFAFNGHGGVSDLDNKTGDGYNIDGTLFGSYNMVNTTYPIGFGYACNSASDFGTEYVGSRRGGVSYFGATETVFENPVAIISEHIMIGFYAHDQLSSRINYGMNQYRKRFWSWLNKKRTNYIMKAFNLWGDPSFYYKGIDCVENFYLTNNELFYDDSWITYQASNIVEAGSGGATFIAQPNSQVNLIGGTLVRLKPGVSIQNGANFKASISECTTSSTLKSGNTSSSSDDFNSELDIYFKDKVLANIITVFPNPVENNLTFYFNINTNALYKIEIFDVFGNKKIETSIESMKSNTWNIIEISASELSKGAYMYIISFDGGIEKGKFVKL